MPKKMSFEEWKQKYYDLWEEKIEILDWKIKSKYNKSVPYFLVKQKSCDSCKFNSICDDKYNEKYIVYLKIARILPSSISGR